MIINLDLNNPLYSLNDIMCFSNKNMKKMLNQYPITSNLINTDKKNQNLLQI